MNLNFAIRDADTGVNEIGSLAFVRSGSDNSGRLQIQPYNAGVSTTRFEIGPGGNVYFPGIGTTASAANAVVNNGSSPANELLRSTSSLKYKTDGSCPRRWCKSGGHGLSLTLARAVAQAAAMRLGLALGSSLKASRVSMLM